MKVRIDKEEDALYFELDDTAIVESEEVEPGVVLDFDQDGRLVEIEITLSKYTIFAREIACNAIRDGVKG